ncbi:titin homolog isoform X2 [Astyanax mexicanus]|uniref:titin homolog isoform X2 n=1 Tax=Astyanax mexicanus TaxID=7994 RepID=UPI0020CB6894|nr:titin homolog isoform X2 [Astyanax mexicanus]
MSASSLVPCIAILLLQLWGAHAFSSTPLCPTPCLCQQTPLLNCSSSGLSESPSHIPATATALDLSHNAIRSLVPLGRARLRGLQHLWVGDNALESLSMCLGKGVEGTKSLPRRKEWCVSWAPDLQLLSAQRNQLKRLPKGLGRIKSLQVLQFAHNQISELGPADLADCTHLREVHLQHNLIHTIHPQAFKDLTNLQVLDLSYNLLTIVPLPAFLSLRNLNTFVSISGNRWRCDCNLQTIRRWLSFDNELGNPTWKVDCFSPAHHAGKDLIHLEESDLKCPPPEFSTPGLLKEVTVDEGTEVLLSCGDTSQGLTQTRWWIPQGHVSENQQVLFISNITEQHAGHYVCISGAQEQHVSIFNLHVRKRVYETRQRREAQNVNMVRNVRAVEQSQFVLAVCLSVFITFIVAFILGVVLRPFLDKLWQRIRNKRDSRSSSANSRTSSAQPRPYDNEGFSDTDEPVQEVRVGSRVTFGGVTEVNDNAGNIPYYVTVEDTKSDSSSEDNMDVEASYENTHGREPLTNTVITHVEMEDLRGKESSIPSSSIPVSKELPLREENPRTSVETTEAVELEAIPDPEDSIELEEKRISSVSRESGLPQEQGSIYEVIESEEQSVDPPTVTTLDDEESYTDNTEATILGFTTDPFSGTLSDLNEENVDDLDRDLWNDSGESFSFPDESPRSSSRTTQGAVLDFPLFEEELSVDKQTNNLGSCSSSESGLTEGEQTEYTVNSEEYAESETYDDPHSRNDDFSDTVTPVPSEFSDYSNGNFNAEELLEYHVHPVYRPGQKTTSVPKTNEAGASISSEDEETQAEYEDYPRKLEIKVDPEVINESVIPVQNTSSIVNINFDNSSTSTDIEERHKEMVPSSEQSFFEIIGLTFDQLPKVKKSLQFSVSVPQPPTQHGSTTTPEAGCDLKSSQLNSSSEESFLGKFDVTLYPVPTVKRYLQFSHSEPPPLVSSPSTSLKTETITPVLGTTTQQSVRPNSSSEDELSPTGDSFFGEIGASVDAVPKVKRYIQFRPSNLQPLSPSASLNTETITPNLVPKTQYETYDSSFRDEHSPSSKEDNFFQQIGASVDEVPKVTKYIQFSETEPQPSALSPPTSLKTETIKPVLGSNTQSKRPDSSSEDEDSFFGQIGASVGEVPKVKRYIQFKPFEDQPSSPSTPINTETITPNLVPNTQSGFQDNHSSTTKENHFFEQIGASLDKVPKIERYIQFTQSEVQPGSTAKDGFSPTSKGDGFFGQIDVSIDEVPKVKRYIQFSETGPQPSTLSPSASLKTEKITPVLGTTTQSMSPDSFKDRDDFFGQIGASIDEVPKVKRYIQFSETGPQPSTLSPSASLKTEKITPVVGTTTQSMRPDYPPEDKDNFFAQIGASVDEVPKVKGYIKFSEPQPSTLSPSTSLKTEKVTPVVGTQTQLMRPDASSEDRDDFFGQIGASVNEVPKVKRYIQFKQSEPQPLTPSTSLKSEKITPVLGTTTQSMSPDSFKDRDDFFGQIGASIDEVPKVKRYIQFSETGPQPSTLSPSASLKTEKITPVVGTTTQSMRPDYPPEDKDNFFAQIGASVDEVPKVKGYIKFSEPQPSTLSPSTSLKTEKVTPVVGTQTQLMRPDASSEDRDDFFGQIGASVNEVPKVKRYIQFKQTEPQPLTLSPSTSLKIEKITPVLGTTTQSLKPDSFKDRDDFFGQIGASIDEVPKVKRYIKFSETEPQPSTLSSTSSLKTEKITPVVGTQTQSLRPDSSSENREDFFGQIGASVDEVPKVKRYIQFSPSEGQPSTLTPSTSLNTETIKPQSVPKTQSVSPDPSSVFGVTFFGQTGTPIEGVPKVKRYIQFSHSEPQPSTLKTEKFTPVIGNKTQSIRPDSSSDDEVFFGASEAFIDGVPKVKQYIKFTPHEAQPLTPSASLKTETITPNVAPQTQAVNPVFSSVDGDGFFEVVGVPIEGVPKVKRYIQFSHSEPWPSTVTPSASLKTEKITPVIGATTQSTRPDSSSEDRDDFFEATGASFGGVPKVKRYIQFTQSEAQHLSPSLNTETITPNLVPKTQSGKYDSSFKNSQSPTTKDQNFFEQIGTSIDEVPRIQRYIEFTQSEVQPGSTSENGFSPTTKEDGFFGQIGASFDGVPKVQRYIQFSQTEVQPSAESPSTVFDSERIPPKFVTTVQSEEGLSQTKGGSFFEQEGTSFDGVPKVKRYIQFSQSEPLSQSLLPSTGTGAQRNSSSSVDGVKPTAEEHSIFWSIDVSADGIPKVKKYIHFTHSASQQSGQSPTQDLDRLSTQQFEVKPSGDKDSFLGGISVPLDDIPKIQRSLQFSQSEPKPEMTVATETSVLDQISRPKRTLFFSNSEPYGQTDQSFTSPQPRFSQSISHSHFDDDEDSNAQDSSPASLGKDDAREYLRDSSQAREKQERRRLLFTQKRRAMDGFKLTTHSYTVQRPSDHNEETFPVYKRNIFHGISTGTADTPIHTDFTAAETAESLSAKSISPLRYKYRTDV